MNKATNTTTQFNAGYDETYKAWLKSNIRGVSFPIPNSYHSVKDRVQSCD